MKHISTEAIILKRLNYSEADRILTVLTANEGRLSLLAKGVRKPKSKLAGGLELFSVSSITFIDGRSELKTIISAQLKKHYRHIVKDMNKTMLVYDFLKALDLATQHGVENGVYDLLEKTLDYLDSSSSEVSLANVWFVYWLLKADGRAINLEKPINTSEFKDSDLYDFSYEDMGFFVTPNGQIKPNHIKFLRLVERSNLPDKLHKVQEYSLLSQNINQMFNNLLKMNKA